MIENTNGYEFVRSQDLVVTYRFTTVDEIKYEVRFVPSTDFFDALTTVEAELFEMVIAVIDNPNGSRLPSDRRVSPTISDIFSHFFLPYQHAIVYICDSSDGREKVRHRKFHQWFHQNVDPASGGETVKVDLTIFDGDLISYLSLIIHLHHPHKRLIVDLFLQLGEADK